MNTIVDEWERYEREVLRKDAPAVQRTETRRAFYAGAWAICQMNLRNARRCINGDQSMVASTAISESWLDECRRFLESVKAGKA